MKRKRIYIIIVFALFVLSFIAEKREIKQKAVEYSMCVPYVSK